MQLQENITTILNPGLFIQIFAITDEFINSVEDENKFATPETKLTGVQKAGRVLFLIEELFPSLGIAKIVSTIKIVLDLAKKFIETIVWGYNETGHFTHG